MSATSGIVPEEAVSLLENSWGFSSEREPKRPGGQNGAGASRDNN